MTVICLAPGDLRVGLKSYEEERGLPCAVPEFEQPPLVLPDDASL